MPLVILTAAETGDGRAVAEVSVRPGRRVLVVVPAELLTTADFAATVGVLVQLTERKGTP